MEIPAGVMEHCTDINIRDDSVALEGDEVFSVVFDISQLPDGMELGLVNASTVRIIDDDSKSRDFSLRTGLKVVCVLLYQLLEWCLLRRAME